MLLSGNGVPSPSLSHCGGRGTGFADLVEARAVVPQDLALLLVGERQLQERVHRLGVARVPMRVVRRKDELIAAELLDREPRWILIGLYGNPALPLEVLTRRLVEVRHKDVTLALVPFVGAPH